MIERPLRGRRDPGVSTLIAPTPKPFCDGTHATIDFDGMLAN